MYFYQGALWRKTKTEKVEKEEPDDEGDFKMEQDEDQDEPMEEESMEEADKEHPEAAEIRELRNRLETFDLVSDTLLICLVL